MCSEAAWASAFFRFVLIFVRWDLIATLLFDSRNLARTICDVWDLIIPLIHATQLNFWVLNELCTYRPWHVSINREFFGATSAVVGRICLLGWNRVTVSENVGATAVVPVALVDTSLTFMVVSNWCDNCLPKGWVDLNSNSWVTVVDQFFSSNYEKVNRPRGRTQLGLLSIDC